MPQQLIYTSAPRGLVAGRSGHCTVARSAAMREALVLQLEKLSYYQHLSLSGGKDRPIYACRVTDIRGTRFHVLTRIQDAGLDFTGRTNFLAHHLIFTPEEIRRFSSPPIVFRDWTGWLGTWSKEPQMLETEDWSRLPSATATTSVPAKTWQQVSGDAVNGYGLLEAGTGIALLVDNLAEEQVLALFAESLELLELRDPRRDFRASAWQYTFTTSMQEQDNPADFRWRCLHSDNPAANRFAGPDSRCLSEIRAAKWTGEETTFARSGRQPPRFVLQPQNVRCTEGDVALLTTKADGVPAPAYQWFSVDRAGNGRAMENGTECELKIHTPPIGTSRYVVRASNSQGEATSEIATLSVDQKVRISHTRPGNSDSGPARSSVPSYVKSEDAIERQRRRIEADKAEVLFLKRLRRKKILSFCGLAIGFAVLSGGAWWKLGVKKNGSSGASPLSVTNQTASTSVNETSSPKDADNGADRAVHTRSNLPESLRPPAPPWKSTTVGNTMAASTAVEDGNGFIINGAGGQIYGKSDSLFFLNRDTSNAVEFVARLYKAENQIGGRLGIMMRDSDKPDGAFAFLGVSKNNLFWLHRDKPSTGCLTMNQALPDLPVFLKLSRRSNLVSGAFSTNGNSWVWVGTNHILLPEEHYLLGFAVASGASNTAVHGEYDRIQIPGVSP